MNLNQQSSGPHNGETHKALMRTTSPLVDLRLCIIVESVPITGPPPRYRVQGIGLRLSDEIAPDMYNYAPASS